ncbi:hypothetical protein Tco_0969533 [Tanacetum coccineum]
MGCARWCKTTDKNKRGRDDEMQTWEKSILWKADMYPSWATQVAIATLKCSICKCDFSHGLLAQSKLCHNISEPSFKVTIECKEPGIGKQPIEVLVGRFHDYGRLIVNDESGGGESVKAKARVEMSEDAGCGLHKFCFMLL